MKIKSFSFVAFLFAVCLLFAQSASRAAVTTPGWIYSYGSFTQNGASVQTSINVYDYGTYLSNGLYFSSTSGLVKSLPTQVSYVMNGTTCTEAWVSGPGSITRGSVVTNGQITVHVWKGIVGGVNASWVQAELRSIDGNNTLLWATGSTWPAASSAPVRMGSLIRLPL